MPRPGSPVATAPVRSEVSTIPVKVLAGTARTGATTDPDRCKNRSLVHRGPDQRSRTILAGALPSLFFLYEIINIFFKHRILALLACKHGAESQLFSES